MQMQFTGPAQIRRAIHSAAHEVLVTLSGNSSCLDQQVDLSAVWDVADTSGVRVCLYLPPAALWTAESGQERLSKLAKGGVSVHVAPRQTPRMVIIDRSVVVLARNQADYSDGALIGQQLPFTPMLVHALTQPRTTEPLDIDEAPLDSRSRKVLRQLTLGATDEKGARESGLTLRTYRRIVARLMEVLEAESRFQAGYLAVKQNWL